MLKFHFQAEDEAPFNFQGMLRKTKYNRASMKRNASDESPFYENSRPGNVIINIESNNNRNNIPLRPASPRPLTPSNKSKGYNERPRSSHGFNGMDENENAMDSMAAPLPHERKMAMPSWAADKSNDFADGIGTYVQEEIRPGVILEGYAVEL